MKKNKLTLTQILSLAGRGGSDTYEGGNFNPNEAILMSRFSRSALCWFRYFLLAAIVISWSYVIYIYEPMPRDQKGAPTEIRVIYGVCASTYGFPSKNMFEPVPIDELSANDRNILLGCAAESGSADFMRWAMMDSKKTLNIESKFEGHWPVALVAGWGDGKKAVQGLELLLEPNETTSKTSPSTSSLIVALYESATITAADYLSKKYPYLLTEENGDLFDFKDYPNYFGLTLAQYHAFKGRIEMAKYFLNKGSKLVAHKTYLRHVMLEKDKQKLLDDTLNDFLVAHGVSLDERDDQGRTVLNFAVEIGDAQIVSALLARGANTEIPDKFGDTPLHNAVANKRRAIVAQLLTRANVNSRNNAGVTPLHNAFLADDWNVAELLLDKGARLDIRDNLGRTPIFLCVQGGCPVLDRITAMGADLNVRDNLGNSLLHEIATNDGDYTRMAQEVIERKGRIDVKNNEGKTPLHLAVEKGNISLAKLLLAKGASVNDGDNLGNTPLHLVHSAELVKVLLSAGANPDLPNKAGERPVNGNLEHAQMLFHSPAQIHTKSDTLPRYFSDIRVHGETGEDLELITPAIGNIGRAIANPDGFLQSAAVELMPRDSTLEFSLQQACESSVVLRSKTTNEALTIPSLPVRSAWQELNSLEGKPQTFRAVINPDKCNISVITPDTILYAIKNDKLGNEDKWQAAAKLCGKSMNESDTNASCELFMRPALRVLVKSDKQWKEVGLLHTDEDLPEEEVVDE